ncbi:MAG TPA: hypothetical protein VFU86_16600 [Terriglobales bacterium]|nr:hypothetical protein [Terriglobales bacterium]
MRKIFVGALVMLAVGICLGQTESPTNPGQDPGAKQSTILSAPKPEMTLHTMTIDEALKRRLFKPRRHIDYKDYALIDVHPMVFPGSCFTMRTYFFSRESDGTPRYKGYRTCVPSNRVQLREARPDVNPPPR